jgi:hypothetical protein
MNVFVLDVMGGQEWKVCMCCPNFRELPLSSSFWGCCCPALDNSVLASWVLLSSSLGRRDAGRLSGDGAVQCSLGAALRVGTEF